MLLHAGGRCLLSILRGGTADFVETYVCGAVVVAAGLGLLAAMFDRGAYGRPAGPAAQRTRRAGQDQWSAGGAGESMLSWTSRLVAALVLVELILSSSAAANHLFLELVCWGFFALLDERDEREAALLLQALRWTIAVFFFYTGLQKLLYGYYFRGEFLAFLAGTEERFGYFFGRVLPAGELERLQSYNFKVEGPGQFQPRLNAGPYRVDGLLFMAISNFVYLFEMAAGVLLLLRPLRAWAAAAGVVFVVLIQVGARELTFGALMINLLLLSLPGAPIRRVFAVFLAGYVYLVLAAFGVVPMFWYSPA